MNSELGKGTRFEIRLPIADARFSPVGDLKPGALAIEVSARRDGVFRRDIRRWQSDGLMAPERLPREEVLIRRPIR